MRIVVAAGCPNHRALCDEAASPLSAVEARDRPTQLTPHKPHCAARSSSRRVPHLRARISALRWVSRHLSTPTPNRRPARIGVPASLLTGVISRGPHRALANFMPGLHT